MNEKILKFKELKSKEPIDVMSVIVDQIVVPDKFKHNNEGFQYLIGYLEGGIVKWVYKILWDAIKNKLDIKFHSEPVYEYKYLKARVREYNGVIKPTFWVMICHKKICIILALLA